MCKYEMDPASIVEDTERTWLRLRTDDGQMDKQADNISLLNFIGEGIVMTETNNVIYTYLSTMS